MARIKIGVAFAFDERRNYVLMVKQTSKPPDTSTWKALDTHNKPKSYLIHDGE